MQRNVYCSLAHITYSITTDGSTISIVYVKLPLLIYTVLLATIVKYLNVYDMFSLVFCFILWIFKVVIQSNSLPVEQWASYKGSHPPIFFHSNYSIGLIKIGRLKVSSNWKPRITIEVIVAGELSERLKSRNSLTITCCSFEDLSYLDWRSENRQLLNPPPCSAGKHSVPLAEYTARFVRASWYSRAPWVS